MILALCYLNFCTTIHNKQEFSINFSNEKFLTKILVEDFIIFLLPHFDERNLG